MLKQELAKRLLNDMILKAKSKDPAVVLIVDPHTSKILSSCLRMYDIMEAGVIVLENILKKRERLDLPAIYFIDPTEEVINALITDFSNSNSKKHQYDAAHLYFTTRVEPNLMKKISACTTLVKKIKSFVELNVDFIALESRVFTFDRTSFIPELYFPKDGTDTVTTTLSTISNHLVSLCLTLKEYPYVRFATQGKSGICKGLAKFFEDDMKKTVSKLSDWKFNETRDRGTLLIVDRSMDPIAPLMHEYTFQAMVNDLLKVEGELCSLPIDKESFKGMTTQQIEEEKSTNTLVLSEDDSLWVDFRHRHIGDVMHDVTEKFREFKGVNKMAKLQTDENSSVKDMIQAMKDMPEYKNMMKKYHKHMSIAQECMTKFDKKKLKQLGELEQDMATGLNNDGKTVDVKRIKSELVKMCLDPQIGVLDKLRLLMIFIISQGGIQDATRKELMKNIDISLQKAIRNLEKLGVELSAYNGKKPKYSRDRLNEFAKRNKTIPLALMRYLPSLHSVIESLVTLELDEEKFPYTSPPPAGSRPSADSGRQGRSARKKATTDWKGKKEDELTEEDNRPRFIVLILGGITYSEMRSVYEIAELHKSQLYVGSSSTLTATDYIRDLSDLNDQQYKSALKSSSTSQQQKNNQHQSGQNYDSDSDEEEQKAVRPEQLAIKFDQKKR